ncbi:NAD(+) diphosphatase [Xanthobacter sp. ZOL 2024]
MFVPPRPSLGAPPPLGYVETRIDRAGHVRPQADALRDHPEARTYLLGGELVALAPLGPPHTALFSRAAAALWANGEPLFLGLEADAPRFATPFDPGRREEMEAAGLAVTDLRSVASGGLVAPTDLGAFACAKALFGWHQRHRFCSNCGGASRIVDAGWRRDCPACGAQHFPRTDPVVIMLVTRGDRCLLGRQPQFAPGMWSCLAGFVEPGETFEDAVRRETLEEAGIHVGAVHYHRCQPWPFPMSLMIGCFAEATSDTITMDPGELEAVRWFERDEVAALIAHTHPDGLFAPAPAAIAHHLMRAFVERARG